MPTYNINLKENKLHFSQKIQLKINELPLVFRWVLYKSNENNASGTGYHLHLRLRHLTLRISLAVSTKDLFQKHIENVTTTGNFDVTGTLKGRIDETHIPKFNIAIKSETMLHLNTQILPKGIAKYSY